MRRSAVLRRLLVAAWFVGVPAEALAGQFFVDVAVVITPGAPGVPLGVALGSSYRWTTGSQRLRPELGPFLHAGWNAWRGVELATGLQGGVCEPARVSSDTYVPRWDAWLKLGPALVLGTGAERGTLRVFGGWGEFGGAHDLGNPGMLLHLETGGFLARDQPMRMETSIGWGLSARPVQGFSGRVSPPPP